MQSTIFRDEQVTSKLLETIMELPGGRRSLSRLARTCRGISKPAHNIVWRELDSLIPLLALFPSALHKRSRRPGLGFVGAPSPDDWTKFLAYSDKVQRLSYDESLNNVAASVFSTLSQHKPCSQLLPNITHLTWKVETPAGLDRCALFIHSGLQSITLELNGTRFGGLDAFLTDLVRNAPNLHSFSFASHTIALPEAFTDIMAPAGKSLRRLLLSAPGAVSARMGKWIVTLPQLEMLQLDLSGRPVSAVESFFSSSGTSSPSSARHRDSGIFSADEDEFFDTNRPRAKRARRRFFRQLRQLSLTGEVSTITAFLKRVNVPLVSLELIVEDPPVTRWAWKKAWPVICENYGLSIRSLRVGGIGSSRSGDLSTMRAEAPSMGISMTTISPLPLLSTFEVELPESVVVSPAEIENLARCCPNLEILKLSPASRFPASSGPPRITIESLLPLLKSCRFLHTLVVVLDAQPGTEATLRSRLAVSNSLLRLQVGHSWISDPLGVTILLSHIAPNLDNVKWFHEKNRPGIVESHVNAWKEVADSLPHLRKLRAMEKEIWNGGDIPIIFSPPPPVIKVDQGVDATNVVEMIDRAVGATPFVTETSVQCSPRTVSTGVLAAPSLAEMGTQISLPSITSQSIQAQPIERTPSVSNRPKVSQCVDTSIFRDQSSSSHRRSVIDYLPHVWILPFIYQLLTFAKTVLISYPLNVPSRILSLTMTKFHEVPQRKTTRFDSDSNTMEIFEISRENSAANGGTAQDESR
jgi:hypothetical protein